MVSHRQNTTRSGRSAQAATAGLVQEWAGEVRFYIRRHTGRGAGPGHIDGWRVIKPRGDPIAQYGRYLRIANDLRQGCVMWMADGAINQCVWSGRNRTRW